MFVCVGTSVRTYFTAALILILHKYTYIIHTHIHTEYVCTYVHLCIVSLQVTVTVVRVEGILGQ